MQLREVQIDKDGFNSKIMIRAPLDQWIELCGLTQDEWSKEFKGDVFKFIKWMNERVAYDAPTTSK